MRFFLFRKHLFVFSFILLVGSWFAQTGSGAAACYGLRKLNPGWNGSCIQVVRSCDNGTSDIGFNSCGDLDTNTLRTFVVAANPLSAINFSAATAYSLRRLSCSYSGNAIRVRSTALGSPTLDIGFTTNGDLDTAALKTFIGANSAFVTIWYDQSGNNRNAIQNTNGAQPRIVNAGQVERQQQRPAVYWPGNGYSLATAAFTTYTAAACFNAVAKVNVDVTYNTMVNKTTVNYPAPLDLYNGQMVIGNGASYNFFGYGQTFNAAKPLSIWTYQAASGGSCSFYYNSTLSASGSVGFYGDNGNPLVLGSRADGVTGLNGWISEVITFSVLPSAGDRQYIEWSQSAYYNISGISLASLPASPASASVSVWYDQSGNGKDALQSTAANQPLLVNAGIIEKNGTVPAIRFTGFPSHLAAPLSTTVYPVSLSLLANTSGSTSGGAFVKHGTSANAGQGGIGIGIGNSGGNFDASGTSLIGLKEWVAWCPSSPNVNYPVNPFVITAVQQSGGTLNTYLNGTDVPLSNAANAVGASMAGSLNIGGYVNGTNRYALVSESELAVYASTLSATRRTLIESNQSSYYNLTVANSKYAPPAAGSYHRFVTGAGRESSTDTVCGTQVSVGMGFTIGQTAGDFLKDNGDYLTIGTGCLNGGTSTLNLPGSVVERWSDDWYLKKADIGNNAGNVTIFFDFGDYGQGGLPGTAANYQLLQRSSTASNFAVVAGTTKTVVGDRVLFTLDASNITDSRYYTIGSSNISSSPLPIELIYFSAVCEGSTVRLEWATASETNNKLFTLENSFDGVNFRTVSSLPGAGTTHKKTEYNFEDVPAVEGTNYYRLRQTDTDQRFSYSPIVVAECASVSQNEWQLYPNPARSEVRLLGKEKYVSLEILNSLGQQMISLPHFEVEKPIPLQGLSPGVYLVRLKDGCCEQSLKLVLQED